MTRAQVVWASEHDWFIRDYIASYTGQRVVVVQDFDNDKPVQRQFRSIQKLKQWAGY